MTPTAAETVESALGALREAPTPMRSRRVETGLDTGDDPAVRSNRIADRPDRSARGRGGAGGYSRRGLGFTEFQPGFAPAEAGSRRSVEAAPIGP